MDQDMEMMGEFMDEMFYDKPEKTVEMVESWCTSNHKEYFFSLKSIDTVPSGLYNLCYSQTNGFGIQKLGYKKDDFLHLPSSPHKEIIAGINKFWSNKATYVKYGLSPKRGIILYGDPGCGKTSCIFLLVEEIKSKNGIAVYFNNPDNWIEVARMIRKIEKDRPILCIIEDIDLVIQRFGEDVFLNFLDGLNSVDNVVYVATTNNINNISDRIKNRPSRFDHLYKIEKPNKKDREAYFKHMVHEDDLNLHDMKKLVTDTHEFSMAHLRETFISLYIMRNEYDATLKRLKNKKIVDTPNIGFSMDLDDEE
jgi:hypothetical protein